MYRIKSFKSLKSVYNIILKLRVLILLTIIFICSMLLNLIIKLFSKSLRNMFNNISRKKS